MKNDRKRIYRNENQKRTKSYCRKHIDITRLSNHIECRGRKQKISFTINSALLELCDGIENKSLLLETLLTNYMSNKLEKHIILTTPRNQG